MTYKCILNIDGVVIVPTPFPACPAERVLPSEEVLENLGVTVELRASYENTFFTIVISLRAGYNRGPWSMKVRRITQYIWDEMVSLRLVTGLMPIIEEFDPSRMPYTK